jgi:hypothetical protein
MDYSKSKIYKLVCKTTGLYYIGSTTQKLNIRRNDHLKSYKKWLNGKFHYISSFEIVKNNNFDIELILEYPCKNSEELTLKETEIIMNNECVNKYLKQTKQQSKQKQYDKRKTNYNLNKDEINEKRRLKYNSKKPRGAYKLLDSISHQQ